MREATVVGPGNFLPEGVLFHIINVYLSIHAASDAVWRRRVEAEGDAFSRVGVLPEDATYLSGVVVAEAHQAVQVPRYDHGLGRVQLDQMDWCLVEDLVLLFANDFEALLLDWRPHTNRLVSTGAHNLLPAVEVRELG